MKNSKVLKVLAYILIPILLVLIILNSLCAIFISDKGRNSGIMEKDSYIETESFASHYSNEINTIIGTLGYVSGYYYSDNGINYTYRIYNDSYTTDLSEIQYLLIDKNDGKIYSNINASSNNTVNENVDIIKNKIEESKYFYIYDGELNTNINNNTLKNIDSIEFFDKERFELYVGFSNPSLINGEMLYESILFDYGTKNGKLGIYITPIYMILEILLVIYLLWSIGHVKNKEGIYQNKFDKWPIEIILALGLGAVITLGWLIAQILYINVYSQITELSFIIFSFLCILFALIYVICAIVGTSFIKKLKTGTLIKTSLTYKIFKKIFNGFGDILEVVFGNLAINIKFIVAFMALMLITLILGGLFDEFGVFIAIILWIYIIYRVMKWLYEFNKIKENLKKMYIGNFKIKLNVTDYEGSLKELALYINEISTGLERAVNARLKSERLKTELITNVSHDIKTPLTSIINYVDLIKKENIQDEKIKEYVEVLDNKSQRLKNLIEDLVEASKANSGNIKLNMQQLNLVELVNQSVGEFSDKFEEKNLSVVINTNKKEEYNIEADTRYMYRIIENIFSNIYKYTLENSRVYIDLKEENKKIKLEIKNISKDSLNITESELMERFVRGDKSRNTEGSGLGLSIAKSLTELQKGKFNIVIDGDLFKVEIEF